jgi:spermidine synthase
MRSQSSSTHDPGLDLEYRKLLLAVFAMCAVTLTYEILKTITLSLQVFHNIAFVVISVTMLGLGGGGTLASWLSRRGVRPTQGPLWISAMGFAGAVLLGEIVGSRLQDVRWLIVVGIIPYVFIGLFMSLAIASNPGRVGTTYAADLAGAALGCLGAIAGLQITGRAGAVILIIAGIGFAASSALAWGTSRSRALVPLGCLIGVAVLLPFEARLFPFRPNSHKQYGMLLDDPKIETRVDWSRWGYLGRLDSVIPDKGIERFAHGKGAQIALDRGCDFRFLFASGDNWSPTIACPNKPEALEALGREILHNAPYAVTRPGPDVLNIGLGGGVDVFLALRNGARSVVGVEINPLMIEAVRDRHRGFFNDPYHDPRVSIVELDGRTFSDYTRRRFDVITLTAVDTGAGLAAGAYVLSENYLYTQEAFDAYVRLLNDDGVIYVFRTVRGMFRVLSTFVAALRRVGEKQPERHVAVFSRGDSEWWGAILSRRSLAEPQIFAMRTLLSGAGGSTTFRYVPGAGGEDEALSRYFRAVREGKEAAYLGSATFDFSPVTDDRPFFYQNERDFLKSPARREIVRIFVTVALLAGALILLPLKGLPPSRSGPSIASIGVFFAMIGVGYMLVEISLIQLFVLYLGHPTYSVSVTIFSLLVFSGLGSFVAGRVRTRERRRVVFLAIAAALLLASIALRPVLGLVTVPWLAIRCSVVVALVAPLGLLMGIPFPTVIATMTSDPGRTIPWAWAANASASVIASVLAVPLAMTLGYSHVLWLAAAAYLIALLALLGMKVRDEAGLGSKDAAPVESGPPAGPRNSSADPLIT